MAPAAVVAALLAQCSIPSDCHCGDKPGWAAIIEYHGDAGGSIVLMSRRPGVAEPAWLSSELAKAIAPEGTRSFISESGSPGYLIDASGYLECSDLKVKAVEWARAVTDGTCHQRAVAAGVRYPTQCRDVAGCSVAGSAFALPLMLVLLLRRRRLVRVAHDP